jgi:hypothetical protein
MAMAGDEQIQVRAEGWNHYIGRQIEQRWRPPLRSWFPPGPDADAMLDWHWRKGTAENSGWHPDRVHMSPQQMLSTIFYGDAIHWGTQRTVVDAWDREHYFWAMKRRFDTIRVAVQLGHLYVGFAAVIGRATGELAADSI